MKLRARNVLNGKVVEARQRTVAALVEVDIGGGIVITSTVTVDAVQELKLEKGAPVSAIIKASEGVLGVED